MPQAAAHVPQRVRRARQRRAHDDAAPRAVPRGGGDVRRARRRGGARARLLAARGAVRGESREASAPVTAEVGEHAVGHALAARRAMVRRLVACKVNTQYAVKRIENKVIHSKVIYSTLKGAEKGYKM